MVVQDVKREGSRGPETRYWKDMKVVKVSNSFTYIVKVVGNVCSGTRCTRTT